MKSAPTEREAPAQPVRVLVVEDDDASARTLERILANASLGGLHISLSGNLSAARRHVARHETDLILLDLGLPDSAGFDTFAQMRAAAPATPLIVLTGLDDEALAIRTVQQGAQDYLVKGRWDSASMMRTVRYAVERHRSQKALAEEHALLRMVIDHIPDQVYLKDLDHRFTAVNLATARFLGAASPDQVRGRCDPDFFPSDQAAQFLAEEQAIWDSAQPCVNREASITDAQGQTRWVLTTKVPLRDATGIVTGLLGINRDITERKQAEEAIRRLNAELEQRVAERTTELFQVLERLKANDQARAEFVANVSHELKTPLTSMRLEIGNLLGNVIDQVSAPVRHYLERLDEDCRRMIHTVTDILDHSRLEAKTMRLDLSRCVFDGLIREVATTLIPQARMRNIDMVIPSGWGLGFVECDAPKLARAITNIITNAIKFTPSGGKIEIDWRRNSTPPETLTLEITDTGVGIAPQHLGHITEKFYRAGERISGTGLGLPIAKELIELHGGRMSVQSPPAHRDHGARVSLSIPAAEPQTVLVAVADASARDRIERQLRLCGYLPLAYAGNGRLMASLRRNRPDVGLFSANAQNTAAGDPVLEVKADPYLRTLPIVAVEEGVVSLARREILAGLRIPILQEAWAAEDLVRCIDKANRLLNTPDRSSAS